MIGASSAMATATTSSQSFAGRFPRKRPPFIVTRELTHSSSLRERLWMPPPPKPQEGVVEALREALTNMKAAFDGLRPMPLVMEPIAKRLSDDAAAALALAGDQP